jgi:hypothetical protein
MPRKILQPGALDFDPDVPVCVRPSLEPELLFSLFAFKFRWKTTNGDASSVGMLHGLNTPMSISIFLQPLYGILYGSFDGIDMAPVKSPDGVAFNQGDRSNGCFVRSDIKAEDSVSHFYYYQH